MNNNLGYLIGLTLIIFSLVSCSKQLHGNYYAEFEHGNYYLRLNKDSTFKVITTIQDASPRCEGTWSRIHNDTLVLYCNPPNLGSLLSNHPNPFDSTKITLKAKSVIYYGLILKKRRFKRK